MQWFWIPLVPRHRFRPHIAWALAGLVVIVEWDGVTRDRNHLPITLVGGLGASVQRMRQNVRRSPADTEQAVAEHGRILAAIEAGGPAAAEEAMRAHMEAVRERSIADA